MSQMASPDSSSKTHLLLEAAFQGDLPLLKQLAREMDEDGKGVKKTIAGVRDRVNQSALHLAAAEGMVHICDYLIDEVMLDVNEKDAKGETPLLNAIKGGYFSTAAYFLKKGARPDSCNDRGFSPLHYAAEKGHVELLHLLLSRGVNVDALSRIGTPLNMAASQGNHEAVKVLLDHHANPGLFLHHVYTPLLAAIAAKSLRCVELLIKADADPDAASCGVTPLALAASEGETEIVKCLLKAGADPDAADAEGWTPLEVAAGNCDYPTAMILYSVTSPIPAYSDWSFNGIMSHALSEEVKEQRKFKMKEKFLEMKTNGDEAFRKRDYGAAIFWYTKAINEDPCEATVLSNRSLCWVHLKDGKRALSDAESCIRLKPDWPKAYYRAGAAWKILEKFDKAAEAFIKGLKLDPKNQELRKAVQEAVEANVKSMNIGKES